MATEINAKLFLGTREDAEALGARVPDDWACLSVTEYRSRYKRKEELPNEPVGSLDLPFMTDVPDGWHADRHKLDLIAETIHWRILSGKKVLVHCIHAQERSPLAVAWYLAWSGAASSLSIAYDRVAKLHPRTERRDKWLRGATPRQSTELIALMVPPKIALPDFGEPKTMDYCVTCGHSPDSGSHLPGVGHEYVDPRPAQYLAALKASQPRRDK